MGKKSNNVNEKFVFLERVTRYDSLLVNAAKSVLIERYVANVLLDHKKNVVTRNLNVAVAYVCVYHVSLKIEAKNKENSNKKKIQIDKYDDNFASRDNGIEKSVVSGGVASAFPELVLYKYDKNFLREINETKFNELNPITLSRDEIIREFETNAKKMVQKTYKNQNKEVVMNPEDFNFEAILVPVARLTRGKNEVGLYNLANGVTSYRPMISPVLTFLLLSAVFISVVLMIVTMLLI